MKIRPIRALSLVAGIVMFVLGQPAGAAVTFETVALTGDAVPGVPGQNFAVFNRPTISASGDVAFAARYTVNPFTNLREGVWSGNSTGLQPVAIIGAAAPGAGPGETFQGFRDVRFNAAGEAAFKAVVGGDFSIWSEGGGSLSMVARAGDQAPGASAGTVFNELNEPRLNNAGQVVFRATLAGPNVTANNDEGIWSDVGGALAKVVQGGDTVPGNPFAATFTELSDPVINTPGQIAFGGNYAGVNGSGSAVWLGAPGGISPVAQTGDLAPGSPPGVEFTGQSFGSFISIFNGSNSLAAALAINDAGEVAFSASIPNQDGGALPDGGMWKSSNGTLSMLHRNGTDAQVSNPQADHKGCCNGTPVINADGLIAYGTSLLATGPWNPTPGVGGSLTSVMTNDHGTVDQLARADQSVIVNGTPVLFDADLGFPVAANAAGQVAFMASLFDPATGSRTRSLWATDTDGVLTLIARAGDQFDVNDDPLIDDFRTINHEGVSAWTHSGGQDGRPVSFNDAGQLAYFLNFTDGSSGIFVASLGSPPLIGDLDGDGFVGITDLNLVLGAWNQNVPPGDPLADPSGDGFVGIEDLNIVLGNWNAGTQPPVEALDVVPEPGSLLLLGAGGLGLLGRGRWRRSR